MKKNNLPKYVADILVDTINIFTNIIDILKYCPLQGNILKMLHRLIRSDISNIDFGTGTH